MLAWVAVPIAVLAGGLTTLATDGQPSGTSQGAQVGDVRDRTTRSLDVVCHAEQGAASGWCSADLIGVADMLPETFLTWAQTREVLPDLDMLAGASLAFREKWPCS